MGWPSSFLKHYFIEHVELRSDVSRALRAMVAFAVPVAVLHWLNLPAEALFVSTASMNLSLPDLRGAYRVRLGILATMALLAASSSFLGVWCAGSLAGAVAGMALVALLGGVWRHLSADYGPSMAVSSALLFLLGLAQTGGFHAAIHLAELTALGGLFAITLHVCTWFFRPQHALRYAVAETWVAASDMVAAMRPGSAPDNDARGNAVATLERELRATLDRTFIILGGAEKRQQTGLIGLLEEMRREVVHFTMRVIALNTSLEPVLNRPDFARCLPVLDSVLKAAGDAARSVATTLIMHRTENLAASHVRLRRCGHLVTALDEQLAAFPADDVAIAQVRSALAQLAKVLPPIGAALAKTVDHAPQRLSLAANLPDISEYSIQSLSAWIRPAPQLDPVLIRHSLRMAVFTMAAVAIYKGFDIQRGYWMAFTIMVVLQPDYGSTRQRAVDRIAGTVGGSLLAGAVLWIRMPVALLDGLATLMAFGFAYFLKRRYGLAIFFVTINLVLITETLSQVHGDFMVVRVAATLLGGGLALVAARLFWPIWEGENFPALLAAAIRANRNFLLALPGSATASDVLLARRRAENANRNVAASVERLLNEPSGVSENPERAAALATYCQRITRALTVLAVQLPPAEPAPPPTMATALPTLGNLLERLAHTVESGCENAAVNALTADLAKLEKDLNQADHTGVQGMALMTTSAGLIWVQLAKTIAELRAMTLALKMSPAPVADSN